ncbi:MAG: glycosyltransferase family 39 protein [Clostridiales bacterium]|nr:glycosyltransferase family 39 protein [Clostridiales bacterium]
MRLNRENLAALFISFILSQLYLFKSPIHPWIQGISSRDSSVFRTIALMMSKGYFPYKDTFDHKGPFLYVLEYLGMVISRESGIWLIELITLTVTFFFMYKTSRLVCGKVSSAISSLLAGALLFEYLFDGNMADEYALPCIAVSLFIFLDYLRNDKAGRFRLIIAGAGLGIVLMLRPNMISVWIVFCIFITIKLIRTKDYKRLFTMIGFFVGGMLVILVPLIIWITANNAFSFFWEAYIVFNVRYSSVDGGTLISTQWATSLSFANTSVFIMAFCSLLFQLKKKKNRSHNIAYLIYLSLTILLIGISGMHYPHYGVILIPALVYPFSTLFADIEAIDHKDVSRVILTIVSLFALSIFIAPRWLELVGKVPAVFEAKEMNSTYQDPDMNAIVELIEQHTTEDEPISVFGNQDIIYILSDRKHATRFSYINPIGHIQPEIMDEYFSQLSDELPNIIVVECGYFEDRIYSFISENDYKLEYSTSPDRSPVLEVYSHG